MYISIKPIIVLLVFILLFGCSDNLTTVTGNDDNNDKSIDEFTEWEISPVVSGGVGKDGIPAIDNPNVVNADQVDFLSENSLVAGIVLDGKARAYPHLILDLHEIANDKIDGHYYSLTYCPLTGSALAWNREIKGEVTTFGVSGYLHNNNLIPYDRKTDSNWSQMLGTSVNGQLSGLNAMQYQVIETTWRTWRQMYPNSEVISTDQGIYSNYFYPYGDYRTNHGLLLFSLTNDDGRLPRKERILGIKINLSAKAYPLNVFEGNIAVFNESISNKPVVAAGSAENNFAVAFYRTLSDGTILTFTEIADQLPIIMEDNEGNKWDITGMAVSGLRLGEKLQVPFSYISYWFAWGAFFPDTEIKE